MNGKIMKSPGWLMALMVMTLLLFSAAAHAKIDGITGTTFNLTASKTHISTPDSNSIFVWVYDAGGPIGPQYPGPTLIVNQGDNITVNLTNNLDEPVSIVFPGQTAATATGGTPGLVTREAQPAGTVTYTFTASRPGTYLYHSGSHQDLQVEMGLFGAIIVRPTGFNAAAPATRTAYGAGTGTGYDREFLFLLSEMDPNIHSLVEFGRMIEVDMSKFRPVSWFINGRAQPDIMAPANVAYLPRQPYNCAPIMHPAETVLIRWLGAGHDLHPFHTHGNNFQLIARDGRMLSTTGAAPDLAVSNFTQSVEPGATYDALYTWTGARLGWDVYGHTDPTGAGVVGPACTAPQELNEYAADHCKPLPVALPDIQSLQFASFYSGSPFLGQHGFLPPGQGINNLNGGYFFMWHSHNEIEITTNDIFPGGMLTMIIVEHPSVPILEQ